MYKVEQFENTAELKEYAKNRYQLDIRGNLSLENAIASFNEQLNEASKAMENSKTEKPQDTPTPTQKPKKKETAAEREQRMMRGQKRKKNIASASALQIVRDGRKARGQR
ncbi:hypothetical protein VCR14J2_390381 [Vibrio coralliirubri]|uniref:hypothetical protein n=1 Tax=Vibrio coralliirubri TaxID=1516159 RepID=UPI000637FBB8|nr:hypothetical protein [Vibrio coralliirubri]CDU05774.1 hypothetical protein VCR14J2_390381 [Vibrio coralliirubri]